MHIGAHMLVVNDDQSLLDLYRLVLEIEGCAAQVSLMAFEEITEVEQMRPDLIILDAKLGYHYKWATFPAETQAVPGRARSIYR